MQSYLETDFEIGHYLKERVVPRAVLFYTGEIDADISDDDDDSLGYNADNFEEEIVESEIIGDKV